MSEAISYYTRNKEEKSEDSGIESGNSLENTGRDNFEISRLDLTRFIFQDQTVKERVVLNIQSRRKVVMFLEGYWSYLVMTRMTCWCVGCDHCKIKINKEEEKQRKPEGGEGHC